MEKSGRQRQILWRILPCNLTENVDRSRDDAWIWIFQFLAETRHPRWYCLGVFREHLIHSNYGPLPDVCSRMVELRDEITRKVASKIGCGDVRHAVQRDRNVGWCSRSEILNAY
jgi:hypothetical protein